MNVLDENIPVSHRRRLRQWHIPVRQIGVDAGRKGMADDEILPWLRGSRRTTFFTRDRDFYQREFVHPRYCLVYLDIGQLVVATYVRRFLQHPSFDAEVKRMGTVVRVSPAGITYWRLHTEAEAHLTWTD